MKTLQSQHTQKHGVHFIPFLLASCLWIWDLPRSVVDNTQWEKTDCLFPRNLFQIVCGLGVGICIFFPFSVLGPCLAWTHILCVLPKSLWIHVCISPVVFGRNCFLGVSTLTFIIFASLPLQTLRRGVWWIHPIYNRVIQSLSLCIVRLWVSVLIPIYCQDASLIKIEGGTGLSKPEYHWESVLCSFSRMIVYFPLGPSPI